MENIPLIKFIKTTPGTRSFIFHNLTCDFIGDVISLISLQNLYFILSMSFCLYNKKNITHWLEDMNFIFFWQKPYLQRNAANE